MLILLHPVSKKSLWFSTQSLIVALISSETTALGLPLSLVLHTFSLLIPKLSPLFFLFSKEIKNRTPGLALSSNCNQLCLDWSLFYFCLNIFPRCFKYFSMVPCRSTQTLPSRVCNGFFFNFTVCRRWSVTRKSSWSLVNVVTECMFCERKGKWFTLDFFFCWWCEAFWRIENVTVTQAEHDNSYSTVIGYLNLR